MPKRSQPNAQIREFLALHLKALEVGLWDYDIDADLLLCDSRWHELLKIKPDSVRRIADFKPFIHPDDVAAATEVNSSDIVEMIANDRRYHIDFRIIRSDGEVRWWRSVACLLIDEESGHRRAIGCVTDITEFRQIDVQFEGEILGDIPDNIAYSSEQSQPSGGDPSSGEKEKPLSDKELECLRWVSVGKTAWETAAILGRSQRTVEFHLFNATRKLSANNKIHAAIIAVRNGLIR